MDRPCTSAPSTGAQSIQVDPLSIDFDASYSYISYTATSSLLSKLSPTSLHHVSAGAPSGSKRNDGTQRQWPTRDPHCDGWLIGRARCVADPTEVMVTPPPRTNHRRRDNGEGRQRQTCSESNECRRHQVHWNRLQHPPNRQQSQTGSQPVTPSATVHSVPVCHINTANVDQPRQSHTTNSHNESQLTLSFRSKHPCCMTG